MEARSTYIMGHGSGAKVSEIRGGLPSRQNQVINDVVLIPNCRKAYHDISISGTSIIRRSPRTNGDIGLMVTHIFYTRIASSEMRPASISRGLVYSSAYRSPGRSVDIVL